jgi:AcrR family transcriptional regulator
MDIGRHDDDAAPAGNRRGQRSRQEILDAAARVMAARGYAGTSMSVLAKESGLPKSAFYHHFQSKAGLLSEVMARGAREFFAAMRDAQASPPASGTPRERLRWYMRTTGEVLVRHQDFLRLEFLLVMSSEAAEAPEAMRTVTAVRDEGRDHMRHMIRSAFLPAGEEEATAVADDLAHFGMAAFDGLFVSLQSADRKPVETFTDQLADALAAVGESRIARPGT